MQYIQNRQIECWISRNFLIVLTVCSLPYRMSFLGFMILFLWFDKDYIFSGVVFISGLLCARLDFVWRFIWAYCRRSWAKSVFLFCFTAKVLAYCMYYLIYLIVLLIIRMRKIIKTMKAVMKKVKMKKTVVINKYHITNVVFLSVIQNGIQKQKKQKYLSFL